MLEIEDYRGEDDGDFDPESHPDFIGRQPIPVEARL